MPHGDRMVESVRHLQPAHTESKERRRQVAESLDEHGYEPQERTNMRWNKAYTKGQAHEIMTPLDRCSDG